MNLHLPRKELLIVGLGNPGKKYELTRHNMGFLVIEHLARKWGWKFKELREMNAQVAKGEKDQVMVHLLKPETFMNLSGLAVRKYIDYFKLSILDLLVVVDDVALPFMRMRLRTEGSSGGHNGLKSIQGVMAGSNFMRLRLGVASEVMQTMSLEDFVLQDFTKVEQKLLPKYIDEAVEILERLVKEDPYCVMSQVNSQEKTNESKEPKSL